MTECHEDSLRLHQTLHGYSHGHQLLARSLDISRQDEREMLVLSDLSGPRMASGFESYLTGYPLPSGDYYVLAKTWYADEMDRPGCVWTHSIIIPPKFMRSAKQLVSLVSLFKRPSRASAFESYNREIAFVDTPQITGMTSNTFEEGVANLCSELYGSPACPIIVFADTPKAVQEHVIRIWSQQWGNLRQSFSFCTGALAPRQVSGRAFDMQVAPRRNEAVWLREVRDIEVHGIEWDNHTQVKVAKWLSAATRDICANSRTELGSFFRETCGDIRGRRVAYMPLIRIHSLLSDEGISKENAEQLVTMVGETCDDPAEGVRLKQLLLEWCAESHPNEDVTGSSVLRALARTPLTGSFDPKAMGLRARTAALWPSARDDLADLIGELMAGDNEPTPLGQEIIAGCIDALSACDLLSLSPRIPGLQYLAVKERPNLATTENLWNSASLNESDVVAGLADSELLPSSTLESVFRAILSAGCPSVAPLILKRLGHQGVEAFLNAVCSDPADRAMQITGDWARALSASRLTIVDWFCSSSERLAALEVVAQTVPPGVNQLDKISSALFVSSMRRWREGDRRDVDLRISSFLLSVGLHRSDPTAADLVAGTFSLVHGGAADGRFSHIAWEALEDVLPRLRMWKAWDTCAKLRLAVARRFVINDWPMECFLKLTSDHKTFERLVGATLKTKQGKAWIKKLAQQVASGSVPGSQDQQKILARA